MGEVNLDTNVYEKILLNFLNSVRPQLTGLDATKKITVKDLENLSSSQFQQLVMVIFGDRASSELKASCNGIHRSVKLEDFNNLHNGFDASYDGQPRMFYLALKKYFPQPDELLMPYVVLNPSAEPQRTRRVLKFLTTFSLYVDQVEGDFVEVYESLEQENVERSNLKIQLNKLKDEINKRMIELQDWGQQVPHLQEESKLKQEHMIELQLAAEKLEEQLKGVTAAYEMKESANKQTNREIEAVKKKIEELERQIVQSPGSIVSDLEFERDKLKELNKRRDVLGSQLHSLTQRRGSVGDIGVEAERAVSFFDELIHIMQDAMDLVTSHKEKSMRIDQKLKEVEELNIRLNSIHCRQASSIGGIHHQAKAQSEALKSLKLETSSVTVKIAELKHEEKHMIEQQTRENESLTLKGAFIMDIKNKIEDLEHYITAKVPAKQQMMENRVRDLIKVLRQEFADI